MQRRTIATFIKEFSRKRRGGLYLGNAEKTEAVTAALKTLGIKRPSDGHMKYVRLNNKQL